MHHTARVRAGTPPPHGTILKQGTVVIEFWPPGADTSGPPAITADAMFDYPSRSWLAVFDDAGQEAGSWTARATAEGPGPQGMVAGVSPYVTFTLG